MKHNDASWQAVKAGDGEMGLFVGRPNTSSASIPAVIVLQEAFGVNAHIRDVTRRVAALGYVAAAPDLFHRTAPRFEGDYNDISKSRPHMDALTPALMEEDLRAVQRWLEADRQADARKVAAVGYCMGGKAAYVANGTLPLKAAISYYGAGIPALLNDYTSRQQAPLLLFWGGQDAHADASKRAMVAEALHKAGKVFTQVEFSAASHGFFCEERKTYDPHAATESWAMLAVFLKNNLKPE